MAYLGRKGAVAPLTSADIPVGIVEGTDIAFLENASGTQNLGGTYSTERMYLNDSYTLTGDVTITGHLALGTVADSDVVITQDSTERTITGSGTLESGDLLHRGQETLTGMTGELGSVVTFPAGHIIQVVTDSFNKIGAGIKTPALASASEITNTDGTQLFNTPFTPKFANSKLLIQTSTVMVAEETSVADSGYMVAFYDTTRCIVCYGSPVYSHFGGNLNLSFFRRKWHCQ